MIEIETCATLSINADDIMEAFIDGGTSDQANLIDLIGLGLDGHGDSVRTQRLTLLSRALCTEGKSWIVELAGLITADMSTEDW